MILLLGGTADARQLLCLLLAEGYPVLATATTEYGGELLTGAAETCRILTPFSVRVGELDAAGMAGILAGEGIRAIVDATHPYAVRAGANAAAAAADAGVPYIRYLRPRAALPADPRVHRAQTAEQAALMAIDLARGQAPGEPVIFLTTGIRTLDAFVRAAGPAGCRVVARVLPDSRSLARCRELGLGPDEILAMRGICRRETNRALLREYGAAVLVTKDSGDAGGTEDKIGAALDLGLPVVVLDRPAPPASFSDRPALYATSFSEVMELLNRTLQSPGEEEN